MTVLSYTNKLTPTSFSKGMEELFKKNRSKKELLEELKKIALIKLDYTYLLQKYYGRKIAHASIRNTSNDKSKHPEPKITLQATKTLVSENLKILANPEKLNLKIYITYNTSIKKNGANTSLTDKQVSDFERGLLLALRMGRVLQKDWRKPVSVTRIFKTTYTKLNYNATDITIILQFTNPANGELTEINLVSELTKKGRLNA